MGRGVAIEKRNQKMSWATTEELEDLYTTAAASGANATILSNEGLTRKFLKLKNTLNQQGKNKKYFIKTLPFFQI